MKLMNFCGFCLEHGEDMVTREEVDCSPCFSLDYQPDAIYTQLHLCEHKIERLNHSDASFSYTMRQCFQYVYLRSINNICG